MKRALPVIAAVALVAAAPATSSKPTRLSPNITNQYWPMKPGTRWVYREGANKKVVVTVLRRTETIMGAKIRDVHDVVTEKGRLVEDTYDWYAQDRDGNVWDMGEATKEYPRGSTTGSWRARCEGREAGNHRSRPSEDRRLLAPGVLQGRGRGHGAKHERRRAGDGPAGALQPRP